MKHRFRILYEYDRRYITEETACLTLHVSIRALHQIHTIWKPHLAKLVPLVDKLLVPTNTKNEQKRIKDRIANLTGNTKRQVNRLLQEHKIEVPAPISVEKRKITSEIAQKRRKSREKYALDVITGHSTAKDAAEAAGVTARQIYRLVHKLCALVQVDYHDLKHVTNAQRSKIADLIEEAQEKP